MLLLLPVQAAVSQQLEVLRAPRCFYCPTASPSALALRTLRLAMPGPPFRFILESPLVSLGSVPCFLDPVFCFLHLFPCLSGFSLLTEYTFFET